MEKGQGMVKKGNGGWGEKGRGKYWKVESRKEKEENCKN